MTNKREKQIAGFLLEVGIPNANKGYRYMKSAIDCLLQQPTHNMKEIFTDLSEQYRTLPSNIERNIRNVIDIAYNQERLQRINELFGVKVLQDKPSVSAMLMLAVEYLQVFAE